VSGSGGGLSIAEDEPLYQALFDIPNNPAGKRGIPDVAYDGDFETGFAVYNSHPFLGLKGWLQIAGTSAGAPQWAALAAIVNSMRIAAGKSPMTGMNTALYSTAKQAYQNNFHDVMTGTNGICGVHCTATAGYDYVTGLGSPRANNLIDALVQAP
jgi:subtilase family serine protease